ncbi:unnamed protein product [Moneuplotes crassus]|uniref:Uncharacterized protein n=1 Tax=Euplotes crassus TaxID=5936 RepID=A0AAD1XM26_EUPCR|nr:unnamed protein product [Moneuplotes crassus]
MYSVKSRIETLLKESVRVALPKRSSIEAKALQEFTVSSCSQGNKGQFHYTTNLPQLIWQKSLEEAKKEGNKDQHDYYGMASAKDIATDIIVTMEQGERSMFKFIEVGNLPTDDGIGFSIDFQIRDEIFQEHEDVFTKILNNEKIPEDVPLLEFVVTPVNKVEAEGNIERFFREYVRIAHISQIYQNIQLQFNNYIDRNKATAIALSLNSHFSDTKTNGDVIFSDYIDEFTDKEHNLHDMIHVVENHHETLYKLNLLCKPIQTFSLAAGVEKYKKEAFEGQKKDPVTIPPKAHLYDLMLDLITKNGPVAPCHSSLLPASKAAGVTLSFLPDM